MEKINITGVPETMIQTFKHIEDRSLAEGMELMYPIYKVVGKIKSIRNLSNKIAVLRTA